MDPQRRRDAQAAETRRMEVVVQAKTWLVLATLWVVLVAIAVFDRDLDPALRTVLAVTGAAQAVAGALWWRRVQRRRGRHG